MNTVEARNLSKSYGSITAVRELSFSVEPGEILGLIGPNGAGKSSTIKMILDFIRPDSGEVRVLGGPMSESIKHQIGYLPEEKGLYRNLTAMELILYLSSLKGLVRPVAQQRAEVLLERAGLLEHGKRKIKEMSKGMGQMIQLIVAIIHEPALVILDEPFSGLDPVNTELTRSMISELRDNGKAIILSTHQMNQVEELCDRILMVHHGGAVLYGDLKETTARFRRKSVVVSLEGELQEVPGVVEVKRSRDAWELVPEPGVTPMMILDGLRGLGTVINRFEIATPSLHEIFLSVVGADDE